MAVFYRKDGMFTNNYSYVFIEDESELDMIQQALEESECGCKILDCVPCSENNAYGKKFKVNIDQSRLYEKKGCYVKWKIFLYTFHKLVNENKKKKEKIEKAKTIYGYFMSHFDLGDRPLEYDAVNYIVDILESEVNKDGR